MQNFTKILPKIEILPKIYQENEKYHKNSLNNEEFYKKF